MGGEWRECHLAELTENFDALRMPVKEADRQSGPYPYYGASGIVDHVDSFLFDGEYLLIAEDGENLRTRKTPVAFLARGKFWVNNHAHIVRGNRLADTRFLMYALSSVDIEAYLTGSTMPKLTQGNMNRIALLAPPLSAQRSIARVLGSLDDKIDLNRRMSETLEAMARALFVSWFKRGQTSRKKATDLIAEGILEIGDGYRAKNSELGAPGLPFVRAGDLDSGFNLAGAAVLSAESVVKAGAKAGRPGDVAFTSKGTIGRFARVDSQTPRFVYSPQVCYWRSLDRERLHPAILYCWMLGDGFRAQIDAVAGQTDMALYVSLRDQRQMEVPVFAADQAMVGDEIETILERQSSLAHESEALAALRDTLLPKLISGELRIPDAERIVGEVA